MKKIKLLSTLFSGVLFILFLAGCKDSNSEVEPISMQGKYLIAETHINGTRSAKNSYDNKNRLTKSESFQDGVLVATTTYTFDAQGNMISSNVNTGSTVVSTKLIYEGGKIKKLTVSEGSNLVGEYTYEYAGNRIVINGSLQGDIELSYTYTLENGNIVKEELVYPTTSEANWTREWAEFDDSNAGVGLPYGMAFISIKNNPGREKTSSSIPALNYDWKWRYTYNDEGYVTSATSYDYESDEKVDSFVYKLIPAK